MNIYVIKNTVNDKMYIGQTVTNIDNRFKRHIGYNCRDNDTKFYRAMKKYGVDKFYIELLDTAIDKDELNRKEIYWIKKLNTVDNGYNTALGSIGGDTLSKNPNLDSIKEKIRKSKIGGKNPNSTKIVCININNNEKTYYDSMADCQRDMNIPRHDIIRRRCLGVINKPYRNKYIFEYITEGVSTIESVTI